MKRINIVCTILFILALILLLHGIWGFDLTNDPNNVTYLGFGFNPPKIRKD